jgi:nicotinamide-nucleotide amidase
MKLTRAAILSVGDELLGGRTINTNAPYLAQRLTDAGFLVVATDTVGDDEFAIADSLKSLAARADTVVVTGGLGPTPDDVTREALAGAAGKLLVPDRALRTQILAKAGGKAPRRNARMARVPDGATVLPNPVGMAAGLRVDMGGTPVYALPGVPLELEAIFDESVLPDPSPCRRGCCASSGCARRRSRRGSASCSTARRTRSSASPCATGSSRS